MTAPITDEEGLGMVEEDLFPLLAEELAEEFSTKEPLISDFPVRTLLVWSLS